jgi:hypothetical protein
MCITSLVWPSNVTMIWFGMLGMLREKNDDDVDVGDDGAVCIACESGDGDRDEDSIA